VWLSTAPLDTRLIIDSSIMTLPVFRARSY
jgi:hypothetical protein